MGKIGDQRKNYTAVFTSQTSSTMDRYLNKPASSTSSGGRDAQGTQEHLESETGSLFDNTPTPTQGSPAPLTADILDTKLQSLLQAITHNIAQEVGKLAKELRGEIDQLGDRTDTLENKLDELVQYVQVLEEDNAAIKHSVTQLQAQQEDLENRERRQNLRIRGIPEKIEDRDLRSYLLSLFNVVAPNIPDIDWRLDRAHRSLAPKPPAGANPRDVVVRFHYYDSKEALTIATRNQLDFKGSRIQIFNDLSPITLARRRNLRPLTLHLQTHKVSYRWGFPFRLSASRDGIQYSLRDLQESEAFLRNLGLPPLPDEDPMPLPTTPKPPGNPGRIWTPVRQKPPKTNFTPQRRPSSRPPT